MVALRYKVPYEATLEAHDAASSKPIRNLFYLRTQLQSPEVLAYGDVVPNTTLERVAQSLDSVLAFALAGVMNVNWILDAITIRQITGWQTQGPESPIVQATNETPISVTTTKNHRLTTGNQIRIIGALGNTNANGTHNVTVTGPKTFTIPVAGNGVYIPYSGTWSAYDQRKRIKYGDMTTRQPTTVTGGSVPGDAIPLQATMSTRRVTGVSGRQWRGGLRMSPMSESDQVNGAATDAVYATWQTMWAARVTDLYTGITGPTLPEQQLRQYHLSSKALFAAPTTLTSSDGVIEIVTGFLPRKNMGVLRRRKPKLTQAIIQ